MLKPCVACFIAKTESLVNLIVQSFWPDVVELDLEEQLLAYVDNHAHYAPVPGDHGIIFVEK